VDAGFRRGISLDSELQGDVSSFDPALLKAYDEVIPEIDRALGE